jgi:nucleoside-diphosphate-sugar epimerase
MDISLARDMIDYHPSTSLKEGLMETWIWFLDHQDEYTKKKNYFAD